MTGPTVQVSFNSEAPMSVARSLVQLCFSTLDDRPSVMSAGGEVWAWTEGRWQVKSEEWLEDKLWLELDRAVVVTREDDAEVREPYQPDKYKVGNVLRAFLSLVRHPATVAPAWVGVPAECPTANPRGCVALKDRVVDIDATARARLQQIARGEAPTAWVTFERDDRWFDPIVVDAEWSVVAECPVWRETVAQWSGGDPKFVELLKRVSGAILRPEKKYERGPLLIGPPRSGKSTFLKLMGRLLGPTGWITDSMDGLSEGFGLDGLQNARAVGIPEMAELENAAGERFVYVWKQLVGRDHIRIKVKYQRRTASEQVEVMPVMASNEIPKLPNKGEGVSTKLLVLPFRNGFAGRERFDLLDVVWAERDGVVRWMLEGAVELEMERDAGRKWPVPDDAAEKMRLFHLENHPLEAFLESRFVRVPEGFVESEMVRDQWRDFVDVNRLRINVPENMLLVRLEQETTWGLRRYRLPHGGARGMRGMLIRRDQADIQ